MSTVIETIDAHRPAASRTWRVLLVDDNEADRVHLAWLLRRGFGRGVEVAEVEDGATALARLAGESFDLVLVDYLLPDMNGFDVLDGLRELAHDAATIFMTGQGNERIAAEAIKRGAHDYCVKRDLAWEGLERAITQAMRTARQRRQQASTVRQLHRTHDELDHFVRALSHDMSANFMLLDSSFRQLKRSCDERPMAGLTKGLTHVEACLKESKRFVDDLVTLARTGSVQMEPARVELSKLVADVLFEQEELLAERGIQFETGRDLPAVWCNEGRIKQVFTNLVRNAARHGCDPKQPRLTISRVAPPRSDGSPRFAWLRVHDNGPGIPAESREEIFMPGKRLPGAHESGSGMGLAIVRKIIEHYGGKVFVDADCRQGTAMVFSLPAA
ncbi:MAG TPA: hybrid sensor histidine kinase/response regulator [Pirellulales bacterium]|nr:hybrid sensor histidine kinase/response regulator [Pirellulales bacterium]